MRPPFFYFFFLCLAVSRYHRKFPLEGRSITIWSLHPTALHQLTLDSRLHSKETSTHGGYQVNGPKVAKFLDR